MRRLGLPALAMILGLAACGGGRSTPSRHPRSSTTSSATSSATSRLSVSPPALTPTSRVTFAFTAPDTAGRHGPAELSFVLSIAGPRGAGCTGARTAAVSRAAKGKRAGVRLGGTWCVGEYAAQVQELARPYCKSGQMCPHYVRLIGTVAAARFRVSSP